MFTSHTRFDLPLYTSKYTKTISNRDEEPCPHPSEGQNVNVDYIFGEIGNWVLKLLITIIISVSSLATNYSLNISPYLLITSPIKIEK